MRGWCPHEARLKTLVVDVPLTSGMSIDPSNATQHVFWEKNGSVMRSVVSTLRGVRREEEPPVAVGDAHAHSVARVCLADISLQDGT